jgi:hypothetical protein
LQVHLVVQFDLSRSLWQSPTRAALRGCWRLMVMYRTPGASPAKIHRLSRGLQSHPGVLLKSWIFYKQWCPCAPFSRSVRRCTQASRVCCKPSSCVACADLRPLPSGVDGSKGVGAGQALGLPIMEFTIPRGNVSRFASTIKCLSKIGADAVVEGTPGKLILRGFDMSKSCFVSFTMTAAFFSAFKKSALGAVKFRMHLRSVAAIFFRANAFGQNAEEVVRPSHLYRCRSQRQQPAPCGVTAAGMPLRPRQ